MMVIDSEDEKAFKNFEGQIVKKDLVNSLNGQINVPAYVLEYLLGKYCSSSDEEVVEAGLEEVKMILSEHYVRPDHSELFKLLRACIRVQEGSEGTAKTHGWRGILEYRAIL